MTDATTPRTLTFSWDLPHAPAKVWRALTEPALLARWLMSTDLRPEPGARFTFRQEPTPWWDGVVDCEMLEVEPLHKLRYTWRSGSGASALDTTVLWTLTPDGAGGTRLQLEHSGFAPRNTFAFEGARGGWERMAAGPLADVLASLD